MILLSGPNISGNEWEYVKECLDTGWVSSVGAYVTKFETMVAAFTGARYGVATSSGTTALHISLLLSGVGKGDYVLVPNVTFVASLNSIKYTGADPILIDIDPETWQMDLGLLENFLALQTAVEDGQLIYKPNKRRIKAIMPVHVLGNMCDMKRLMDLVEKYPLEIIEDATESLGSSFDGQHSGTFGQMGCFSFNGNKIITCGGGGVIVTNNPELAKKAKHLTTQAKSDPFEYLHDEIGYNYRLVNVAAAMGVAQMEQLPSFIKRKHEIATYYKDILGGVGDITFQKIGREVSPNWWLFTIRTNRQREILKELNGNKIESRPFWVPMNQLKMFRNDIYVQENDFSNEVYQTCLSIPCSTNITEEQLMTVTVKILKVFAQSPKLA